MYLSEPPFSSAAEAMYAGDRTAMGYVMTGSRLWAHAPDLHDGLFDLLTQAAERAGLNVRERGILITACASTLGDSYCSMAWGYKLASVAGAELTADVLRGADGGLSDRERALAAWARRLAADPNGTAASDVEVLRSAGYDDAQVLAVTAFVALRIAFSTVNDALGVQPEPELVDLAPEAVRAVVTYGRPFRRGAEWRRGESNP
jgi:alkylhydroperoxidase family enzyme